MSAKPKLKLALFAATAVIVLNPGSIFTNALSGEALFAQEMPESRQTNGLGVLLAGADPASASPQRSVNDALAQKAPKADSGFDAAAAPAVVKQTFAPGENPFVMTPQAPASAARVQSASLGPMPSPFLQPAAPGAKPVVVNPFGQPAAVTQQKVAEEQKNIRIDDSALRYYAAAKDLKRLGAEMRRLKELYPNWQPPKDLFSTGAQVSEQPLWDIYKTGNYAAVRAQIAQMQSANPKWQPSDDLLLKLQMAEARTLVNRSFAQRNWQQVISTAQSTPSLLVCEEMQVLWNVGEAFARMRNYAESFELYRYVLDNCTDEKLRFATVQKASLLLPQAGVDSLIALGKALPDESLEFEDIAFNNIRTKLGDFIQNGSFTATPSADELGRFVEFINRKQSAADANLIGWYFYAQEEWKDANAWFLQATRIDRDPKTIDGVILTLRKMDQQDDALKVAYRYLNASPAIARQYIEIVAGLLTEKDAKREFGAKDLETFEKVVVGQKSALGAQVLGWKYLNDGNKQVAANWFADSVNWEPTEGGVVGLAVLASRAKDYKQLTALKTKYGSDYKELANFKIYTAYKPRSAKKTSDKKPKTFWEEFFGPNRT